MLHDNPYTLCANDVLSRTWRHNIAWLMSKRECGHDLNDSQFLDYRHIHIEYMTYGYVMMF